MWLPTDSSTVGQPLSNPTRQVNKKTWPPHWHQWLLSDTLQLCNIQIIQIVGKKSDYLKFSFLAIMMNDKCVKVAGLMQGPGISGGQAAPWIAGLSRQFGRARWLCGRSAAWGSDSLWREGESKRTEGGKKRWGWERLDRKMGRERKKRAKRSARWRNNMTSHWASLRLPALQGSIVRQRAANDVLKVKPSAGLMGPEGPAVLDAAVH